MKQLIVAGIMAVTLTGCATSNSFVDGLLGRYHNYDPIEYAQAVSLVVTARSLETACADINVYRYRLDALHDGANDLRAYAEGRPYNQHTAELVDTINKLIKDTASKETMGAFFCRERSRNIVKATEILRAASGEKPE
jgi:hypothetical protein